MLSAIQIDSGSLAPTVKELLTEIVKQINRYSDASYNRMMQNCRELAQFTYASLDDWQSGLFLAEISIFAADKNREKLLEVEELLDDLSKDDRAEQADWLRCQARLLTEQGKFEQAAELWSRVSNLRKNKTLSARQQGWQWWQAKFYELYCWGRRPEIEREKMLHTIEVLENTFPPVPPLWAERLNSLKKEINLRQK
jgi:tetratricopeptide (TPR) repeat protein